MTLFQRAHVPLVCVGLFTGGLLMTGCSNTGEFTLDPIVFYPAAPEPPRVQFLRSVSLDTDIEGGRSDLDQLLFGEQEVHRAVIAPYGATVHDGLVYVCDIQQGVVLTFDFPGRKLDFLRLDGRGRLQKPVNLHFDDDGRLYIADLGRRQVVVVDPPNQYVTEWGPFSSDSRPTDVDVWGDRVLVADAGSHCVRLLDRATGDEIRIYSEVDEEGTTPRAPTNVTHDDAGRVYVTDSVDCVIYVWEEDGTFAGTIGSPGDTVGQFARPKGLALHGDLVFVVDAAFENCQIMNKDGQPLMFFGGSGVGPGDMYLPAGLWVGKEGLELFSDRIDDDFTAEELIIVTNQFGPRKVNFYALGHSEALPPSEP